MEIKQLEEKALQCLSQPATDEIVYYLKKNDAKQALTILLREEGHWISKEAGSRLIEYWTPKFR